MKSAKVINYLKDKSIAKNDRYISNTITINNIDKIPKNNLMMNNKNKNNKTQISQKINLNEDLIGNFLGRNSDQNKKKRLLTNDSLSELTYNKLNDEEFSKYNNLVYKEIKYENKNNNESSEIDHRKNKLLKNKNISQYKAYSSKPLYKTLDNLDNNFETISNPKIHYYNKIINKTINGNNKRKKIIKNDNIKSKVKDELSKYNYNNISNKKGINRVNINNLPLKEFKGKIQNGRRKENINTFKNKNKADEYNEKEIKIKKICKLQAVMKGRYLRKLMNYYWINDKLKELISLIIINRNIKNNSSFIKSFNNLVNLLVELNVVQNKNNKNRKINKKLTLDELKNIINKFHHLLIDFNNKSNQISELKLKNEELIRINKKYLTFKGNEEKKTTKINNNNFGIINNNKSIHKLAEGKNMKDNDTNYSKKFPIYENQIEKDFNKNENSNSKYLNHFFSNLNVTNNGQFLIEKSRLNNGNKIQDKYEINSYNFFLNNNKGNNRNNLINEAGKNILCDKCKMQNNFNLERGDIYKKKLKNKNIDNYKINFFEAEKRITKKNKDLLLGKKKNKTYDEELIKSNINEFSIIKDDLERKSNIKIEEMKKNIPCNYNEFAIKGINNKFIQGFEFINNVNKIDSNYYEMEKGEGLEINPYEIKRTKNNINNVFISYENKIQILNNKESIFTEKAKHNIMKIIFLLKFKKILKERIRKDVFKLLSKGK